MPASLVASQAFTFADGGSGKVLNLGSAPTVGYLDLLCVGSNTTVSDPAGFLIADANKDVANMGMYLYRRIAAGGEGSTVTVTTSGNHDTFVGWLRFRNINAADDAEKAVSGSAGSSSPAISSGTLAEANELAVAFAALHNIGAADQNTPIWTDGFTGLLAATQGSGASGVVGYVAYRTNAGTAAVTPSVSWSGATASDRGIMTLTFTTVAGGVSGAGAANLGALTASGVGSRSKAGAGVALLGGLFAIGGNPAGASSRVVSQSSAGRITATTRVGRINSQTEGRRQ